VHNLRNLWPMPSATREIDSRRLGPCQSRELETATAAANACRHCSTRPVQAQPSVTFATESRRLNELVTRSVGMARPRARTKEVQLAIRETPDQLGVRADPLLMKK